MKEYKRLTERVGKSIAVKETSTNDNKSIWNAIERLAELEDKIENGTLIELPCKVGDTVYYETFTRNGKQNISMKEMLTKKSFEPITNCNCKIESRIDYAVRNENKEGTFTDLLNQEIEELQKAKAIEEMAKIIEKAKQHIWASVRTQAEDEDYLWHSRAIAEHLTEQGYQKIDKDKQVVFSREELEKWYIVRSSRANGKSILSAILREELNEIQSNFFDSGIKHGSKETAKEFLQLVYDRCIDKHFIKKAEELAKQFGVELKE